MRCPNSWKPAPHHAGGSPQPICGSCCQTEAWNSSRGGDAAAAMWAHCSDVGHEIPQTSIGGKERGGRERCNALPSKELGRCHMRHVPSSIDVSVSPTSLRIPAQRTPLDVKRDPPKKTKKYIAWGAGLVAVIVMSAFISRLKPAAPPVERATLWID